MSKRLPGNKRERVKDLRMERGLSLSELASRVGCNETTLGRYERGETDRIGDEIVRSLAREFNVSIDYLMGETDIPYVKNFDILGAGTVRGIRPAVTDPEGQCGGGEPDAGTSQLPCSHTDDLPVFP